jgi:glycosyltransferase involved in cell wall biosynthesis
MRFSSEKDPVGFLKTVALILQDRPDARAVLVGDGPLRGEVDVFLSHSGFASSVLLTGAVDRADGWMKRASVVVSTSHVEGMPNVLLEAQACGVPVVATDVGGTREALAPNLQEYVRPDSDWPGLANACLQLLNDAALRQREGAQALAWVRQARSLHALAENTLKAAPAP